MYKKVLFLILVFGFNKALDAKHIEYYDSSCQVAAPNLISMVEEVAQEIGYDGDYELVEPTPMGVLANPWNRMMYTLVNPQDQNNLILINPTWFAGLNLAQQRFLIARFLIKLKLGSKSFFMQLIPYLFGLLSLLFLIGFLFLLNKTVLSTRHFLIKVLIAIGLAVVLEVLVLDKISAKVSQYAAFKFNCEIDRLALAKLPDQQAAVSALKYFDQTIKAGIADGHNLFKLAENTFANLAQDLEKQ